MGFAARFLSVDAGLGGGNICKLFFAHKFSSAHVPRESRKLFADAIRVSFLIFTCSHPSRQTEEQQPSRIDMRSPREAIKHAVIL